MIHIVTADNRHLYSRELAQMHCQRRAVFVETLNWHVPVVQDLEIDAYDRPDTVYLLLQGDEGVLASARLFPTMKPHLMRDVFAHLCALPPPQGPRIWEASRFCVAPGIVGRRRLELLWQVLAGIMETCQHLHIEEIIFTANSAFLPLAMQCGWEARALGATAIDGNDQVTPVAVRITHQGLEALRRRFTLAAPITLFATSARSVAA